MDDPNTAPSVVGVNVCLHCRIVADVAAQNYHLLLRLGLVFALIKTIFLLHAC